MNFKKWALLCTFSFFFTTFVVSTGVTSPAAIPEEIRIQHFKKFQESVLPSLRALTKELGLLGKVEPQDLADAIFFGYQVALVKLGKPFGTWDEEIKRNTGLFLYKDCFIDQPKIFEALPLKPNEYVNALAKFKNIIYRGALDRYIVSVALRDKFYMVTYELFEKRRPKNLSEILKAEEIFNFEVLEQAENIRSMFK